MKCRRRRRRPSSTAKTGQFSSGEGVGGVKKTFHRERIMKLLLGVSCQRYFCFLSTCVQFVFAGYVLRPYMLSRINDKECMCTLCKHICTVMALQRRFAWAAAFMSPKGNTPSQRREILRVSLLM